MAHRVLQHLRNLDTNLKVQAGVQYATGKAKDHIKERESMRQRKHAGYWLRKLAKSQATIMHESDISKHVNALSPQSAERLRHIAATTPSAVPGTGGLSLGWTYAGLAQEAGNRGVSLEKHLENMTHGQPTAIGSAISQVGEQHSVPQEVLPHRMSNGSVDWERTLGNSGATNVRRDIANTLDRAPRAVAAAPTHAPDWARELAGTGIRGTTPTTSRMQHMVQEMKPVTQAAPGLASRVSQGFSGMAGKIRGAVSKLAADEYAWNTHGMTEAERAAFGDDTTADVNKHQKELEDSFSKGTGSKEKARSELKGLFDNVASGNYVARQQTLREKLDRMVP